MKNVVIYCRVSSEEQARKGYSLDAQEKYCSEFAKNKGLNIVGVFRDEGRSGTTLNRPALKDVLSMCQQNKSIDALLIQETDRLARNTKDHLTVKAILKKEEVQILSVAQPMLDDSPEGAMIDTIIASINQFQSDINSRKTKKGLQERFDQGWFPGWVPLGYLNKAIEGNNNTRTRKIVIKDPDKWILVKEGFELYLTGEYSVDAIKDILNEKGLRSKNGKKLQRSVFAAMLKNPFYTGIMKWNGQEKIGKHEPIITLTQHQRIQDIIASHNMHACRKRKHLFLLTGFIYCNACGLRYTADKNKAKKKEYYHCANRHIHSNRGQNIPVNDLEKQIEEQFKKLQFSDEFINGVMIKLRKLYYEEQEKLDSQKSILSNKKKAVESKRDIAEEKLLSGTISDDDFIRLSNQFKLELKEIQNQVFKLEGKRDYDVNTIQEILKLCRNIYEGYKDASYELKRNYLGLFWDKFMIQDKKIVKSYPSLLTQCLLEENKVMLRPNLLRSPLTIITLLNDQKYISYLKEKLKVIRVFKETDLQ